jgi:hypothetical protein
VVRANVLENDLCLYRCVSGVRQPIMSATVKLQKDQWYKIGIQCQDENIRCYLDDKLLIEGKDKKFLKGKIGLWSKADSVTYFDNLEIVAK